MFPVPKASSSLLVRAPIGAFRMHLEFLSYFCQVARLVNAYVGSVWSIVSEQPRYASVLPRWSLFCLEGVPARSCFKAITVSCREVLPTSWLRCSPFMYSSTEKHGVSQVKQNSIGGPSLPDRSSLFTGLLSDGTSWGLYENSFWLPSRGVSFFGSS